MSKSVRSRLASAATLLALGALAMPLGATPARGATEHVVDIADMAFGPTSLTIVVGDTVTWTNSDSMPHTATDEDDRFDSGNLDPGQSFSFTFTAPGTYAYRCDYHSDMVGTIVVEEAAAPSTPAPAAAASSPAAPGVQPDTAVAVPGVGTQLPALMMGIGLVIMAASIVRLERRHSARTVRSRGGWRR